MSYDILHMSIKATTNIRRSLWELTLEVQPGKTVWGWNWVVVLPGCLFNWN